LGHQVAIGKRWTIGTFPNELTEVVVTPGDAKNVDIANLFLNYILAPENAALISNCTRCDNMITGSDVFTNPILVRRDQHP
jgi:spermidine/putrescine-binding protein